MTIGKLTTIIAGVLLFIFLGIEFIAIPWCELIGAILGALGTIIIMFVVSILIFFPVVALVVWLYKHWDDKVFKRK